MTRIHRRRALLLAALALVLGLAAVGCGEDEDAKSTVGNAVDAAFVTDMTAHHEGAIAMARIAQERAEHPEIRRLAEDIVSAQAAEISTMRTIGRELESGDGEEHMGMSDAEMGMDMDPAMLRTATPFDQAFIDMMVPHHEGGIAMAKTLLAKGEQPALRKLATDIINAQADEIAEMREWRETWYGTAAGSMNHSGHDMTE